MGGTRRGLSRAATDEYMSTYVHGPGCSFDMCSRVAQHLHMSATDSECTLAILCARCRRWVFFCSPLACLEQRVHRKPCYRRISAPVCRPSPTSIPLYTAYNLGATIKRRNLCLPPTIVVERQSRYRPSGESQGTISRTSKQSDRQAWVQVPMLPTWSKVILADERVGNKTHN